jgi:hypothetical protein
LPTLASVVLRCEVSETTLTGFGDAAHFEHDRLARHGVDLQG